MHYHGRLSAIGVVLLFNLLRYLYYHQYLALPFKWNFFILTFIFLVIAWWSGKQFDNVKYMSERDPLTGTYNRRTVEQTFQKLARVCDQKNQSLGIIMLDLNNFKEVNDEYGHQKGDELLIHTASTLNHYVTKDDLVARWGGDEFIILAPNIKEDFADDYVQKLQRVIKEKSSETFTNVGASIGYAIYPGQGDNFQKLIQEADTKMYKEKKEK
ncbi:GGDEF domain-containing protein [Psychrobacillus sp. OK032]|uniref:GGDEF domain-containing protein n=1 Tax=Psychrobacillus sp. OK032 TaxID=1884358 RepID=UPI0008B1222A|nr:GGDEF domain-containing protein [Psychrobacillus sp. OK032]SES38571.1 diguanylate cyclase (GGDEF) domain-containing protein [Psychrobacillus sp. OK032]